MYSMLFNLLLTVRFTLHQPLSLPVVNVTLLLMYVRNNALKEIMYVYRWFGTGTLKGNNKAI